MVGGCRLTVTASVFWLAIAQSPLAQAQVPIAPLAGTSLNGAIPVAAAPQAGETAVGSAPDDIESNVPSALVPRTAGSVPALTLDTGTVLVSDSKVIRNR